MGINRATLRVTHAMQIRSEAGRKAFGSISGAKEKVCRKRPMKTTKSVLNGLGR